MTQCARTFETGSDASVDVWLSHYDEINDARLHAEYRALLSPEERFQEPRFHTRYDQRRYLITRAMIRTVLSRYVAREPRAWRFVTNRYGRPAIANDAPEAADIEFNVSHTPCLIALGVTRRRGLGVDVENVGSRSAPLHIADRCLAATELAELARVPRSDRQLRFFEYWTFKESYAKARGIGLSMPLEQLSFHYPHERTVRMSIQPQLDDDAERWCFWQFSPTPRHLLAICAERQSAEQLALTLRRVVPLVSEELLDWQPRRSSCR